MLKTLGKLVMLVVVTAIANPVLAETLTVDCTKAGKVAKALALNTKVVSCSNL